MALILVGGQARNVGKTTLVCNIIAAFPQFRWNAAKVTNHRHNAAGCELRAKGVSWSVWEQISAEVETDTSRFIRSGAQRAWLIQAEDAALEEALSSLGEMLTGRNLIVESTRLGIFLDSDLCLLVADARHSEFKPSARRQLERIDAIIWRGIPGNLPPDTPLNLRSKPSFPALPSSLDVNLARLIRAKLPDPTD